MLIELVRNPRPYFADRIKYPSIRKQAVIVVIAGMIAHSWRLSLFSILGGSSDYIASILIIFWFGGVVEFIAAWLLLTGIMQFVANLLGGDVSYGRLLRLTGYGFTPLIISGAIWSAGHYIALQDTFPPPPPLRESFVHKFESYSEFMAQVAGDPAIYGAVALGSLFVVAAGYLWYLGVSVASDLSDERAGAAAGIAVAVYLGWIFYTLI
jgi:hypothetical protein